MDYIELTINCVPRDPWAAILVAQLSEIGFESFVDTETGVMAYAPAALVNAESPFKSTMFENEMEQVSINYELKRIPHQNWNRVWESEFSPVYVDGSLTILAPFHDRSQHSGMLIEIEPRMSFGTGHHQTTRIMCRAMLDLEKMPKRVLDVGTGTGVLAILAEKLGAVEVLATEIEEWSVENANENVRRNQCQCIEVVLGDIVKIPKKDFGLIIANINKNVLKAHLPEYAKRMSEGGRLLLSGFFLSDCDELVSLAGNYGFQMVRILDMDNWAAIEFLIV